MASDSNSYHSSGSSTDSIDLDMFNLHQSRRMATQTLSDTPGISEPSSPDSQRPDPNCCQQIFPTQSLAASSSSSSQSDIQSHTQELFSDNLPHNSPEPGTSR